MTWHGSTTSYGTRRAHAAHTRPASRAIASTPLVTGLVLALLTATPSLLAADRPLVGAIRWDAWQDDSTIRPAMQTTLGPEHWHERLPFFTQLDATKEVSFTQANLQATMDREIAYARQAGLDYWAFVTYPADIGMSNGLKLYLASAHKSDIRFALDLQGGWLNREDWEPQVQRYVGHFKESSYQKVLGNRPLVYLFDAGSMIGPRFTDWAAARKAFDQLRQATVAAGLGQPYVVVQGWNAAGDKAAMQSLGADAIGAYAVGSGTDAGSPYSALAQAAHQFWEADKATGANVVPIVATGWDPRPRVEHPIPWAKYDNTHYLAPTPAELTAHLLDAMTWTAANAQAAPANVVLMYAWNEHDEGGWLCPTLKPDGSIDTSRVEACREAIGQFGQPPAKP